LHASRKRLEYFLMLQSHMAFHENKLILNGM
jgi:hypothetical protein